MQIIVDHQLDARKAAPTWVQRTVFPITMCGALFLTWALFSIARLPHEVASFIAIFLFGFILIPTLEHWFPYRKNWNNSDGDVATDIWHLLVSNLVIVNLEKPLLIATLVSASAFLATQYGTAIWPSESPLLVQLFLMLFIAEFGRYWVHFAAHKVPWLWRLHAVHHSPNRLYFLNAGRFHPLEKVIFQLPEVVPFILLGTNIETITLYLTFNTIHGFFQHSNIALKNGWLNYVFSLPELHRWHHSKNIDESDRNFGNNLILWDILFGTYYNPNKQEVVDIGLLNDKYPKSYSGQLMAPFKRKDISKLTH